jgi:hypothetical protein
VRRERARTAGHRPRRRASRAAPARSSRPRVSLAGRFLGCGTGAVAVRTTSGRSARPEEHLVCWAACRQARGAPRARPRRARRSRLLPAPHRGPHRCRTPSTRGAASSGPRPTPTNRSSTAVNLRGESR